MTVQFNVKVNTQLAQARLAKFQKAIDKAGQATVQQLVNMGKEQARVLVPKGKTGWLYNTIQGQVLGGPDPKGKIFLNPKIVPVDGVHRRSKGNYPNFNLARWMHTSSNASSHFRRPDREIRFMDTTRDILNQKKKGIATGNYKGIKV